MTPSFGQHICILELDLNEHDTTQLVHELRERLGRRIRTTTKTRWLHDAERQPIPPMRNPDHFGNTHQAKPLRRQ